MRKSILFLVILAFALVAAKPVDPPMQIVYWTDHDAPRYDTWCDGKIGDDDWFKFDARGDLQPGETFSVTSPKPTCLGKLVRTQYQYLGKKGRAPEAIEAGVIDPLGVFHSVSMVYDNKGKPIDGQDCFSTLGSNDWEAQYYGYYTWTITNQGSRSVEVQLVGYLQEDEYNQGCGIGW